MIEKMGHSSNLDRTPQTARLWTESSPNSKLKEINKELNSLDGDKAKKLKDLIKNREYTQFQKEIGFISKKDLDGKLGGGTLNKLRTYLKTLDQTESKEEENRQETKEQLGELGLSVITPEQVAQSKAIEQSNAENSPEKIQNQIDNLKINRAAKKYLSKYETLSTSFYNLLFSGKEEMGQGQLGNCYLISGLIELANTQYFDTLMKTSISRVKFKDDGTSGFSIKIPLGEPDGRDILIKDSEILMAKVRGNIGYKLLELAYVKSKRPNDKSGNTYYPVTDSEIEKTAGGTMTEVLQKFLGHHNIGFCDFGSLETDYKGLPLSSLPRSRKTEITNYLKNFDGTIGNNFTNLGTPIAPGGDSSYFEVGGNTLYNQHVYALSSVEKNKNGDIACINVKNPRNKENKIGGSEVKLSLNEFFDSFSFIGVGKIKVDTFLDDKGVSYA